MKQNKTYSYLDIIEFINMTLGLKGNQGRLPIQTIREIRETFSLLRITRVDDLAVLKRKLEYIERVHCIHFSTHIGEDIMTDIFDNRPKNQSEYPESACEAVVMLSRDITASKRHFNKLHSSRKLRALLNVFFMIGISNEDVSGVTATITKCWEDIKTNGNLPGGEESKIKTAFKVWLSHASVPV